jgi:hypothetical protein
MNGCKLWITLWTVWISFENLPFSYCKIEKNMVFGDPFKDKEEILCGQKKA